MITLNYFYFFLNSRQQVITTIVPTPVINIVKDKVMWPLHLSVLRPNRQEL